MNPLEKILGDFIALLYNKNITTTTLSSVQTPPTIDNSQYDYAPSMNEQLLHLDYSNTDESYEKMLLDESEKLYNKVIDDIISKAISFAMGKSIESLQSETQPYTEKKSSHKLSTFTYREKEQTFIQSEIGNKEEDQDS